MIRRPPRSTLDRSSAASDVYKRQLPDGSVLTESAAILIHLGLEHPASGLLLSLIHISEPTRPYFNSYAVFCLKIKTPGEQVYETLAAMLSIRRACALWLVLR